MNATITPPPTLSSELKQLLRRVKLGRTIDALPERLALAKSSKLSHAEFLALVLADEVERRDRASNTLRARKARLDPAMTIHTWDGDAAVTYDRDIWAELTSLRFLDDFALQPIDAIATADFYELIVERHHKAATVITSNRDSVEWLAALADPLLAQSAIDRLASAAWELVIDGESYRQRQRPTLTTPKGAAR